MFSDACVWENIPRNSDIHMAASSSEADDVPLAAAASPQRRWLSDRSYGYVCNITAVMLISPDAMLLRLPHEDENPLLVAAWRCSWIAMLSTITVIIQAGSMQTLALRIKASWRGLLLVSCCTTMTSLGFPLSLQLTGSAEALLLIALNPLWGALLGWRILGDRLPRRTVIALACALASIAIIFAPRVIDIAHATTRGQQYPHRLAGDLIAFITGWGLATFTVSVRYAKRLYRDMPTQCAQVVSNTLACTTCLLILAGAGRPLRAREPLKLGGVTLLMGVLINMAYLGFNAGPRYLLAAECCVISLLETALGPLWVYLATGEAPTTLTVLGGALLLTTLVIHEVAALSATASRDAKGSSKQARRQPATSAKASGQDGCPPPLQCSSSRATSTHEVATQAHFPAVAHTAGSDAV